MQCFGETSPLVQINATFSPQYATPNMTKYKRCNFRIQIHQFTIKFDKVNINLLVECVTIVEFDVNSHVFHVVYQEIRFLNKDSCFFSLRREATIFDQGLKLSTQAGIQDGF